MAAPLPSGAFNVTSNAIVVAHDIFADVPQGGKQPTGKASVDYIFFNALDGQIVPQGTFEVDGLLNGWSADNGRWNIDLTDNTVSVFTCSASQYGYCNGGAGESGYKLTTVDFTNPAAPRRLGVIDIASKGYAATARFANKRMYLSPRDGVFSPDGRSQPTPLDVYDLSTPGTPKLAGSTTVNGAVWLFMPVGTDRLFALGNEYEGNYSSSKIALRWIDVADATQPKVLGTSSFGDGWAWTPAAGTFKAFTRDEAQKLVVLPFSGWSRESNAYMNGVQLIEYDTGAITTKGAARSKGWVERGIFAKNRLVSLSDQALSVIDYTDRSNPKVVTELTLARNVVSAEPNGATIAQLSTDWWGYDTQKSELRVLPIANAEENVSQANAPTATIDGTNARVFRNGDLAYVVTTVFPKDPALGYQGTPHIQIVDLANGGAVNRGTLDLPVEAESSWSWWSGCYYWDWYDGSSAMLVGNDALAFRRTRGAWDPNKSQYTFDQKLYIVDLSNADAPKLTSTAITTDTDSWWGNIRVVGNTLYTTHYEWLTKPVAQADSNTPRETYYVRYYLDQIDLSDRANPKVGQRINVPGMLVGASETDPSLLYFVDYRWYADYATQKNDLAVARIKGGKAYLQSSTVIDGWVGNVFVRGSKAYTSAQEYAQDGAGSGTSKVKLHEIDLTNPKRPVDRASTAKDGWGWLLDVEGDRAILTSGWGQAGLDIYKLADGQAPVYSQFARTRGWWSSALSRQGDDLYLSTGYWGVQKIVLK